MAKNNNLLFYILLFAFVFSFPVLHAQLREKVALVYSNEIGTREKTGNNDGKRVEEYLKSCNLKKGNPWCAAFVTWTFKQSKVEAVISAYSPSWFPSKSTIYTKGSKGNKTPLKADVFGIYFSNKKRIAHVGFIDEWDKNSYCITVEGNTNDEGSREGDGVYRKRRLKNQIYKVSRYL